MQFHSVVVYFVWSGILPGPCKGEAVRTWGSKTGLFLYWQLALAYDVGMGTYTKYNIPSTKNPPNVMAGGRIFLHRCRKLSVETYNKNTRIR